MNAQGVEVEERLGRSIMSGLHGMWSVGGLVASGFGVLAAHQHVDARLQCAVTAAILAVLAQVVSRGVLDVRPTAGEEAPPRFALPPKEALVIGLVGFCAVFAEGASMDWSGVYLRDITGASASSPPPASPPSPPPWPRPDWPVTRWSMRLGPVRAVRLSGVVAATGGLLVVVADTPYVAIPGFALIGIGIAVVVPLAFAAAGRAGSNPSQSIAGVATITYTSGLVAPAVVGGIAQASSLTVSFVAVTLLAAALIPSAAAMRHRNATGSPVAASGSLEPTH